MKYCFYSKNTFKSVLVIAACFSPILSYSQNDSLTFISISKDSVSNLETIKAEFSALHEKGFYEALLQDTITRDRASFVKISKGPEWTTHYSVRMDSNTLSLNSKLETETYINNELFILQNNGYPFANFKAFSQSSDSTLTLLIQYLLEKGQLIQFDSLTLFNNDLISERFIVNYLDYKVGKPYSEEKLKNIRSIINGSGIVKMDINPSVFFYDNKAFPQLTLKKVNSNKFDGIIGIQPGENQSTSITGLLNLQLKNTLKRGEEFWLNWERLDTDNQRLKLGSSIPYILKSKAGVSFDLSITRQDSTLNRLQHEYGLDYHVNPNTRIKIRASNTINNSNQILNESLPNSSISKYGLGFFSQKLDYYLNPKRGFKAETYSFIGNREGTNTNSSVNGFKGDVSVFIPIKKKGVFVAFTKGESIGGRELSENDIIQTGGLNSIRGVDQRSLLVSSWITFGTEYRFIFEKKSALYVFAESHFHEQNVTNRYTKDQINAFGAGLNIGNKNGVFTFSYGISNEAQGTFLLRNGKINFGYSSNF